MNRYTWQDMMVGLTHEFERLVTEEDMGMFLKISGDVNPLHADANFAARKGFSSRVVYGMLVASYFSTLSGVYLPGESCLLHGVDTQFIKPVFVGDRLKISGTVTYMNEVYRQVWIQATVTNQHGELVSKAKIKAGILDG